MKQQDCLLPIGVDLKWLEEKLPYIPVNLLEDVVDLTHKYGKEALGVFTNGVIELANNTPKGVEYHEAFHAVFNSYLSEDQRNKILKETKKLEELLADDFADYILYKVKPESSLLNDFFKKIKFWIKEKLGLININDLYSAIDNSYFANKKPFKYEGINKYKEVKVEKFKGFWTREIVSKEQNKIFLFGDNTKDRTETKYIPTSTQAVIRGLPNAIGIDTKKNRGVNKDSYFSDNDFEEFKNQVDTAVKQAIRSNKIIVLPEDGIGTGKAMLKEKAPILFSYLQEKLESIPKTSPIKKDWTKVDTDYISETNKIEIVKSVTYDVLNTLIKENNLSNIYYLDLENYKPSDIIREVRDCLLAYSQSGDPMLERIAKSNNLAKLTTLTLREIEKNTDISIKDIEDSSDLLGEEEFTPEIWDQSPFKKDVSDKFSTEFRMFLSTIPKVEVLNNEIVPSLNNFGIETYMDRGIVQVELYKDLSNVNDADKMVDILKSKISEKPFYKYIVDALEDTKDQKVIDINNKQYTTNNFKNQLFSNLNNYFNRFISTNTDYVTTTDTIGNKSEGIYTRSYITNDSGINNEILNQWRSTVNREANIEALETKYNDVKILDDKSTQELYETLNKDFNIDIEFNTIEFYKDKPSTIILGVKELFDNNQDLGRNSNVRKLATKDGEYKQINNTTITRKAGDKLFVVGNYTPAKKLRVNLSNPAFIKSLKLDTLYKTNRLFDSLTQIFTLESDNITEDGDITSSGYQEMEEVQWELNRLHNYYNNEDLGKDRSQQIGTVPFVTPSDASNIEVFNIQKRTWILNEAQLKQYKVTDRYLPIKSHLFDSIIYPEFERIKAVKGINSYIQYLDSQIKNSSSEEEKQGYIDEKVNLEIKNWNKNGQFFMMFPELNTILTDQLLLLDKNKLKDVVYPILEQSLKESLTIDFNHFTDLGIVTGKGSTLLFNSFIVDSNLSRLALGSESGKLWLLNYFIERYVANTEATMLQCGDLAFYKSAVDKKGNFDVNQLISSTHTDANKRSKQAQVPSRSTIDANYDVMFVESLTAKSEYFDAYKNILGDLCNDKTYGGTDRTDAATFCTIDRAIQIFTLKGKDGQEALNSLKRIAEDGDLANKEDINFVIQAIKSFSFGHLPQTLNYKVQDLKGNWANANYSFNKPTQIKHAVVPLIPTFTKNYPQLEQLRLKMEDSNISEFIFDSAVKAGATKVHTPEAIQDWLSKGSKIYPITLSMENWGEVLDVPYKDTIEEKFSTQKMRLAMVNVEDTSSYNVNWSESPITGKELKDYYNNAISNILKEQYEGFKDKIFTEGKLDVNKLKGYLKDLITANDPSSFTDYWDNLFKDLTEYNLYTLDTPQNKDRIYSLIAASYNKSVLDINITGKSAVLASTYGMYGINIADIKNNVDYSLHSAQLYDSTSNITDKDLIQIQREYNRLGKQIPSTIEEAKLYLINDPIVSSDEVVITPAYFIKSLKKKGIDPTIFMDSKGNFNVDLIPEPLRFVSFHRIPYQDKNSNSKAYIKDFTNVASGTLIYFNPDLLTRSGGDFDIDKVYIEFFDYNLSQEGEWSLPDTYKNRLIESHLAVAASPLHYKELITPNNTKQLEVLRDAIIATQKSKDKNPYWFSVQKQSSYRKANKACKDLIGLYSVGNVFHGIAQQIKPTFTKGFSVRIGKEYTEFGNKFDEEGNLISDNNMQYGSAAVDGVKDPILGELNHNLFTAPLKMMLNLVGVGKTTLEYFTNNPMYIDVVKYYNQYILTESSNTQAVTKAFNKVAENIVDGFTGDVWISLETLNESVKPISNDPKKLLSINEEMFFSLMYHHKLAEKFNSFVQGSRLSNSGIKNNIAENVINFSKYKENFLYNSDSPYITYDKELFNSHWLKTYEDTIGKQFTSTINEINTYHKAFYRDTFKLAKDNGIKLNNREQVAKFYSGVDVYLAVNNDKLVDTYKNSGYKQGNFLSQFPIDFYNWLKKESYMGSNYFLDNIVIIDNTTIGIKELRFRDNKDLRIDSIIDSYTEFYNKYPKEAKLLFGYTFKRYGFSKTKISPMKYMEPMFEDLGVNEVYQKDYNLIQADQLPPHFIQTEFINDFARNNKDMCTRELKAEMKKNKIKFFPDSQGKYNYRTDVSESNQLDNSQKEDCTNI